MDMIWRAETGIGPVPITKERADALMKEPWPNPACSVEYSEDDGITWQQMANTTGYVSQGSITSK